MAKFQARGGYQISVPPRITGNIHDFLNYSEIAAAGTNPDFTAEAIFGIGSGIAQMFEDEFKPEKKAVGDKPKDDFKPTEATTTSTETTTSEETENVETQIDKPAEDQTTVVINPPKPPVITPKDTKYTYTGASSPSDNTPPKTFIGHEGGSRKEVDRNSPKYQQEFGKLDRKKIIDLDITKTLKEINEKKNYEELFNSNKNLVNAKRNAKGPFGRFKDESPLERISREQPQIFEALNAFAYPYKGTELDSPLRRVAHASNSPMLKTGNLKYREMREMVYDPKKRGSIETAFQEGFNEQVSKYNYSQKVKADFENEAGDEVNSLVVDVEKVDDLYRKSVLDTAQRTKTALYNDYIDYINGDINKVEYESKKLGYQSEINELTQANENLEKSDKEFYDNKHLIDKNASDPAVLDFYNTRQQAPQNIEIRTTKDGVKYYVGKTINGQDFQLPVSKIANGTAGMNLVQQVDFSPGITNIVTGAKKIKEQLILENGYAMQNIPADDPRIMNYAKSQIKSMLNDENNLRSAASTYGDLGANAYKEQIEDSEDKELLMNDLTDQMYEQVFMPQYVPERKQTVSTSRSGGGSLTAAEREVIRIKNNFDSMGNISEENYRTFLNEVPNFEGKYRAQVKDNVLIIADAKSGTGISKIDLSNPTAAKAQLANLAGVSGYRGETYDATSLIAKYSN